jgi:hypothetical protein
MNYEEYNVREIFDLAWQRMTLVASIVGEVQGRVIVTGFYFTILVPFGLGSRLFSDPLRRQGTAQWLERAPIPTDLESAQQQG